MHRTMIAVIRGSEVRPGVFAWRVRELGVRGYSRQPLLDACRWIESVLGPTSHVAGLFREGRDRPDLTCRVDIGASLTVEESQAGGPRFRKFRAWGGGG
jgi:hypothetical protein